MGQIGIWQIVIIGVVAILLFGRGKISAIMGDVAQGINAFKRGMRDGAQEDREERRIGEDGETIDARARATEETRS